jgi:hypothetical protein
MDLTQSQERIDPVAASTERPVQVLATTMKIHDLSIERPAIVAYLRGIAPEKQEIALVHALEVGITELVARRERFRH